MSLNTAVTSDACWSWPYCSRAKFLCFVLHGDDLLYSVVTLACRFYARWVFAGCTRAGQLSWTTRIPCTLGTEHTFQQLMSCRWAVVTARHHHPDAQRTSGQRGSFLLLTWFRNKTDFNVAGKAWLNGALHQLLHGCIRSTLLRTTPSHQLQWGCSLLLFCAHPTQ
jgi:hypothetical protein